MVDYYFLPWLKYSQHFTGVRVWSYEFHWKQSHVWYHNFKKVVGDATGRKFRHTRLTLRLGKHIVVIGGINGHTYYKDVQVLTVKRNGKITFNASGLLKTSGLTVGATKEDIKAACEKQKTNYEHLSKAYPENTWRN